MDKITKLSQAIRYGSTFLGETKLWMEGRYLNGSNNWTCGCALGTAYLALNGTDGPLATNDLVTHPLAERFGVPVQVLINVSLAHYRGEKTRAQCADWLESLGY